MSAPDATLSMPAAELRRLAAAAATASGARDDVAASLAAATVAAQTRGKPEVGAAHLLDYLAAMDAGVLNGRPTLARGPGAGSVITLDADRGPAQYAFDMVADDLATSARRGGVAVLSVGNGYTAGELGYYTVRLADEGLVALACSNSPALMSVYGACEPLTGTNPLSFALPHPDGPRMFDQAASATAWVKVRGAAAAGAAIPHGWALDAHGRDTDNAQAGLAGALLPFGGAKAANIALMVEALAALSGGAFSLDATDAEAAGGSPGTGLFVLALDPDAFDPDYPARAEDHWAALAREYGTDFGRRHPYVDPVEVDADVVAGLRERAGTTV